MDTQTSQTHLRPHSHLLEEPEFGKNSPHTIPVHSPGGKGWTQGAFPWEYCVTKTGIIPMLMIPLAPLDFKGPGITAVIFCKCQQTKLQVLTLQVPTNSPCPQCSNRFKNRCNEQLWICINPLWSSLMISFLARHHVKRGSIIKNIDRYMYLSLHSCRCSGRKGGCNFGLPFKERDCNGRVTVKPFVLRTNCSSPRDAWICNCFYI